MTLREPLPVHGFVLAGGRSSRMGRDKALLPFRGLPMVEIAVENLRTLCEQVSIAANRDDLRAFAPVVHEDRVDIGPGAALEAGLLACTQPWALFLPVDVPLLPPVLLRGWAEAVHARTAEGCRLSFLHCAGQPHPAIVSLHRDCLPWVTRALDEGDRKLERIFDRVASGLGGNSTWNPDAESLLLSPAAPEQVAMWFTNLNKPEDLAEAEVWAGQHLSLARSHETTGTTTSRP